MQRQMTGHQTFREWTTQGDGDDATQKTLHVRQDQKTSEGVFLRSANVKNTTRMFELTQLVTILWYGYIVEKGRRPSTPRCGGPTVVYNGFKLCVRRVAVRRELPESEGLLCVSPNAE